MRGSWFLSVVVLIFVSLCARDVIGVHVFGNGPPRAKELVAYIVPTYLPFLEPFSIEVVNWNVTGGYYLRSSPKISTAYKAPLNRTYQVFVNPVVFNVSAYGPPQGPPLIACKAILTHELTHCSDYANMTVPELAEFGLKYALDYPFHVRYEHYTDQRVIQLRSASLDQGLADYRTWIYGELANDPVELAKKKIEYMTPEQIQKYAQEYPPDRP